MKNHTKKEVVTSTLIGLVGMILTLIYTNLVLVDMFHIKTVVDSVVTSHSSSSPKFTLLSFVKTFLQLILEEMWRVIPFLFVLMLYYNNLKVNKKRSVIST